jgi:15-cis-phytoene synthase
MRASNDVLARALTEVLDGLAPVSTELEAEGMPVPSWSGQLIRPVVGVAGVVASKAEGPAVWKALAAVQLAHEASLVHDDVIDGATERRGKPTLGSSRGVAAALVEGDHLLTAAYRLAAGTRNLEWMEWFTRAVERTVAGEKAQGRAAGRSLEWAEYEAIVLDKSGGLIGAALAAGPAMTGSGDVEAYYELGRRVGLFYQMVDDLLDYLPGADTGKPALVDRAHRLWTWPLAFVTTTPGMDGEEVARALAEPGADGLRPLDRAVARLRTEAEGVINRASSLLPCDVILPELIRSWLHAAEAAASVREAPLPPVAGWEDWMADRARSFRFAAHLFPSDRLRQVEGVYAWCRYTDDLVDVDDATPKEKEARLDAWLEVSRRAYEGATTGNDLADRVMAEMQGSGVPFGYARELIEGMRMDLEERTYGTIAELRLYTFRVASVVGLWLTELFGVRDPWMLDRAAALGHAMQMTNILRDVGEDLARGRIYLPSEWLGAFGLERSDLERMAATGQIDPRYEALIERLLQQAESEYDLAEPAIGRLPDFFRKPVAVAARVYRGIHDRIRANGYDNLTRRAHTSFLDKLRLGAGALLSPAPGTPATSEAAPPDPYPGHSDRERAGTGSAARAVRIVGVMAALAVAGGSLAAQPSSLPEELERVGMLWVEGVEDASAAAAGLELVRTLGTGSVEPGTAEAALLRVYEGAFLALRAKHGGNPRARLRDLRAGFEVMDGAVATAPTLAELRYIRLMSGFHLPAVFGRRAAVREDMEVLAHLLPAQIGAFPPAIRGEVVDFVLSHGRLEPGDRTALEALR